MINWSRFAFLHVRTLSLHLFMPRVEFQLTVS
jgi:hypothetical protein